MQKADAIRAYLKIKKSRQRPTLARASPALPSAMEPLTSVFGMGTGVTTPLWPPAKTVSWELKRTTTYETGEARSHIEVKFERNKLSRTSY